MQSFAQRSYQPELLDEENIPKNELFQNLRELEIINRYLGGHDITLAGVRQLIKNKKQVCHIVDVGCGGGDTLIALARWGQKQGIPLKLTGVDIKSDVLEYARQRCRDYPEISLLQSDYRDLHWPADIFVSSLFCHHLNDAQLRQFLAFLQRNSRLGFVINDLQRHPLAYYSIQWLTRLFNGSVLVKNDAPLSVLRGFHRRELEQFLQQAGVAQYRLSWKWAFRYLIVGKKA